MFSKHFKDKVFVITGAASGIGKFLTKELLKMGSKVVAIDKNFSELKRLYAEDNNVWIQNIDLANHSEIESFNPQNFLSHHKISGFVHCAGIPCLQPLKGLSHDILLNVININAISGVMLFKKIVNRRICSNDLKAVFISSIYGLVGSSSSVAYSMSKGAINSAIRSLSIEYSSRNININGIAPGFIKTEMFDQITKSFDEEYIKSIEHLHPLGLGDADDVVMPILFLLSPMSKWITGQVISIDGGYTVQ